MLMPFINPYNNVEDVMCGMHYAVCETGPFPVHLEMEALIIEGRKPESVAVTATPMRYSGTQTPHRQNIYTVKGAPLH